MSFQTAHAFAFSLATTLMAAIVTASSILWRSKDSPGNAFADTAPIRNITPACPAGRVRGRPFDLKIIRQHLHRAVQRSQ